MEGISIDRATDWLMLVAALVTSMVIFTFLFRILRALIGTVIMVAAVALAVQFFLGISPTELLNEAMRWAEKLLQRLNLG
ncbi:MAG: hypothetical protein ACKO7W_16900 [Elainella sp.]